MKTENSFQVCIAIIFLYDYPQKLLMLKLLILLFYIFNSEGIEYE